MEKALKIVLIAFIIVMLGVIFVSSKDLILEYLSTHPIIKPTITGVVVKVNDNNLLVMGTGDKSGLYSVGFTDEGNIGFKQGQEVLIKYNGWIADMYPAIPEGVSKITILNDKSDIEIPEDVLRYCYSSKNNIKVNVSELTNKGMTWNIIDANEFPYRYSSGYRIIKKVKNPDYPKPGHIIGENTKNSTSGYDAPPQEYIWQDVKRISNISYKETEELLTYNLPNIPVEEHYTITGKKLNWEKLYGVLDEGEYRLDFSTERDFSIFIFFTIDKNGDVTLNKIEMS